MSSETYSELAVKTICMQAPEIISGKETQRKPLVADETIHTLLLKENILRKLAYKNSLIKTGESFFDDSDMRTDYSLVIVYDKSTGTPLLSSRYYFDLTVIQKYVRGENSSEATDPELIEKLHLNSSTEKVFLADRLSGNASSTIYRKHRNAIFLLYYSEILKHHPDCYLILMARKEKQDKLLKKYLLLGFSIVGSTIHQSKEHWIIITDLKKAKPNA